jgi:hypothetical protein
MVAPLEQDLTGKVSTNWDKVWGGKRIWRMIERKVGETMIMGFQVVPRGCCDELIKRVIWKDKANGEPKDYEWVQALCGGIRASMLYLDCISILSEPFTILTCPCPQNLPHMNFFSALEA